MSLLKSQTGVPTLLQYLQEKYARRQVDQPPTYDGVTGFVAFAEKCLAENPPVRIIPVHEGLGLALADNTQVTLLPQPAEAAGGDMQPSSSIAI